jgi:hypothetical protein
MLGMDVGIGFIRDTMRRLILPFSVAFFAATVSAGIASAGDRYGPPEPVKPVTVSATDWNGPQLGWTNKGAPESADARPAMVANAKPVIAKPAFQHAPAPAPAPAAPLPTSLYAPPPAPVAPHLTPAPAPMIAPSAYQPSRPTGEVLTLSLADLPPPGPSLERQQAAEEDAAVLAAKIARADAQAAKDIAAGKPQPGDTTQLLGGS